MLAEQVAMALARDVVAVGSAPSHAKRTIANDECVQCLLRHMSLPRKLAEASPGANE